MADSFFGFNTALSQGLELDDDLDLDEEEYDALNDETFGADAFQGNWEEDHNRFAEVTENSRAYKNSYNSDKDDNFDLEASLSQLVLEGEEETEDFDVGSKSKEKTKKSNSISNKIPFDYIGGYISSPAWSVNSNDRSYKLFNKQSQSQPQDKQLQSQPQPEQSGVSKLSSNNFLPPQIPRIPTVQELERNLLLKNKQSKYADKENKNSEINQTINQDKTHYPVVSNNSIIQNSSSNNQFQNIQQQNAHSKLLHSSTGSNKFPPGFAPQQQQQNHFNQLQQQQEMVVLRNNQNMPMQLGPLMLPPSHLPMLFSPHILPPPPPPPSHPLMLQQNTRMVPPHPMIRLMPNHPLLMQQYHQQHQQLQIQQQQTQQKQQILQNQRQNKTPQNNHDQMKNGQASRNQQNASQLHPWLHNPRRGNGNYDEYAGLMNNRERQWLLNIQIIQLATDKPHLDDYYYMTWLKKQEKKLKEETRNGLTNNKQNREPFFLNNRQPKNETHRERKDSERDTITVVSPRVYVPLQFENSLGKLQCGSVTAPRKIIDLDVVPELQAESTALTSHRDCRKTKKILLELEKLYLLTMDVEDLDNNAAPEVNESTEDSPSKPKLLEQIMTSFLNEDRFVNFMCIRKGKTLLLRVLPHLDQKNHDEHLTNIWSRVMKSISVIIRKDQNDGILLQLYPYLKNWINIVNCTVLSVVASHLLTANTSNARKSSRAVSPNPGKSVLSYILTTTFGVSVVCSILSRGETLYPSLDEKEKLDWTNFILNFIKHMTNLSNLENQIPTPLDPLPENVLTVILNRSTGLHIQDYASAKRVLTAFNKDKSHS